MSLVNAFVNQIGREIGHDVYRSATSYSYIARVQSKKIDFNESFLSEINKFELAAYDKVTVRQLINLIEKSKGIASDSFDFQECYTSIDNKIDFCKQHLDKEFQTQLEELDKLNETNYRAALSEHKNYISELILKYDAEIKSENKILPIAVSLIGLNPIYYKQNFVTIFNHLLGTIVGIPCLIYGTLMYFAPLSYHGNAKVDTQKDVNDVKKIALIVLIIGAIFYLPIIFSSLKRIMNFNKVKSNKIDFFEKLKHYYSTIK